MTGSIATSARVEFRTRGVRRKPGYGLSYRSVCERYLLYKSDQVDGVAVRPVRWLAIRLLPFQQTISHHKTRDAAAKACNDDARSPMHAKERSDDSRIQPAKPRARQRRSH
jgi:hypothetical protein